MPSPVWMLLLPMFLSVPPKTADAPAEVPFRLSGAGGILIAVTIGENEARFLLDTGATRSAISERLAHRLGLSVFGTTLVGSSIAASGSRPLVRLPDLRIGRFGKTDVLATLLDPATMVLADGADGIIGMDTLGDRGWTIDYRRRVLRWNDGGPVRSGRAVTLPARLAEGRWLVSIEAFGEKLWFVPDSGADVLVLLTGRAVRSLEAVSIGRRIPIASAGGNAVASAAMVPELRLGGTRLHRVAGVVVTPSSRPTAVDGLLPLNLFASVSFDPAAESITLEMR